MTAVPPPVPPEIGEKAALGWHVHSCDMPPSTPPDRWDREIAEVVLAAVYGDIVEAARRDALAAAVDRAAQVAARIPSPFADNVVSALRGLLRDENGPSDRLSATESVQGAVPRIPGTPERLSGDLRGRGDV